MLPRQVVLHNWYGFLFGELKRRGVAVEVTTLGKLAEQRLLQAQLHLRDIPLLQKDCAIAAADACKPGTLAAPATFRCCCSAPPCLRSAERM